MRTPALVALALAACGGEADPLPPDEPPNDLNAVTVQLQLVGEGGPIVGNVIRGRARRVDAAPAPSVPLPGETSDRAIIFGSPGATLFTIPAAGSAPFTFDLPLPATGQTTIDLQIEDRTAAQVVVGNACATYTAETDPDRPAVTTLAVQVRGSPAACF